MHLHSHTIRLKGNGKANGFWIYLLGDLHIGSSACEYKIIKETVKEIQETKNAVWFGLGDYGDYISFRDKRFDPEAVADLTDIMAKKRAEKDLGALARVLNDIGISQTNAAYKFLEPIREKGILLLEGNHERTFSGILNPASVLASYLGIPFGGYCAGVNLRLCTHTDTDGMVMKILLHHGSGGGGKDGGKLNKVIDWAGGFENIDLVAVGHYHKRPLDSIDRVGWTNDVPPRQYQTNTLFVINGTAKKSYPPGHGEWEERMMFRPSSLGFAKIFVWTERPEMTIKGRRYTPRVIRKEAVLPT